jgi:hypothetical protein
VVVSVDVIILPVALMTEMTDEVDLAQATLSPCAEEVIGIESPDVTIAQDATTTIGHPGRTMVIDHLDETGITMTGPLDAIGMMRHEGETTEMSQEGIRRGEDNHSLACFFFYLSHTSPCPFTYQNLLNFTLPIHSSVVA